MAVKELVDLTSAQPSVLPKTVLEAIGDRIKDRKVFVTATDYWREASCVSTTQPLRGIMHARQ